MTGQGIDWAKLHQRIQESPVIQPVRHIRKPNRSPESIERRAQRARERWKAFYWDHREHCLERQRAWELANPEKVKAKRKRSYEKYKDDPEFKAKKAQYSKLYKARKKQERLLAQKAAA